MKVFLNILILTLGLGLSDAHAESMKIFFEESEPFDGQCWDLKQHADYKITPDMRSELRERKLEFEKLWNSQGLVLVNTMETLLKHRFERKEVTLTFTLCQWFSPMSSPLILRMREYLRATAKDNPKGPQEIKPNSYFVGQVFHELIHQFLDKHFDAAVNPKASAMLAKHSSELPGVISHLHHLSIQKAVYLKLKRENDLATIVEEDSKIRGGTYKRAWEIVNEDGYQKYIDELVKFNK